MELLQADKEFLARKGYRYETFLHNGYLALVILDFDLPAGYLTTHTNLLILLPAGFPDAAPDMWWCEPWVTMHNGSEPPSANVRESIRDRAWQRFSRHFTSIRWTAGRSGVESYVTLIKADMARTAQAA